jgi:hypothetical protein
VQDLARYFLNACIRQLMYFANGSSVLLQTRSSKVLWPDPLPPASPSDVSSLNPGTSLWICSKDFLIAVTISTLVRPHWSMLDHKKIYLELAILALGCVASAFHQTLLHFSMIMVPCKMEILGAILLNLETYQNKAFRSVSLIPFIEKGLAWRPASEFLLRPWLFRFVRSYPECSSNSCCHSLVWSAATVQSKSSECVHWYSRQLAPFPAESTV